MIEKGDLEELFYKLLERHPKSAAFYMLPNIHKEGTPGRPVISNIGCPTYEVSKFLSHILRPIVGKCPTYVRDTTHLLEKLEEFRFEAESDNNVLFTMDVKGLYNNV